MKSVFNIVLTGLFLFSIAGGIANSASILASHAEGGLEIVLANANVPKEARKLFINILYSLPIGYGALILIKLAIENNEEIQLQSAKAKPNSGDLTTEADT